MFRESDNNNNKYNALEYREMFFNDVGGKTLS